MESSNTLKVVRNSECSLRIWSSVTSVFSCSSGSLSFRSTRQILTNLLPWLAVMKNPLPVEWRTSTALSWYLLDLQ